MPEGKLEKMKIYAYNNPVLSDEHLVHDDAKIGPNPFEAYINPENYTVEKKMEFRQAQAQGTTGNQAPFELKPPEEMAFEFLLDDTGLIPSSMNERIKQEGLGEILKKFSEFLLGYDSSTHEPKFFKLVWGDLLFKGRCTSLNIAYKLFNPNGKPIRAVCKVTLKEFKEDEMRVAEDAPQSPDLTHYRRIKQGDTLPLMCYRIYGDSKYYLQVAKVNKLSNFRHLKVGDEIFFPPIAKASTN